MRQTVAQKPAQLGKNPARRADAEQVFEAVPHRLSEANDRVPGRAEPRFYAVDEAGDDLLADVEHAAGQAREPRPCRVESSLNVIPHLAQQRADPVPVAPDQIRRARDGGQHQADRIGQHRPAQPQHGSSHCHERRGGRAAHPYERRAQPRDHPARQSSRRANGAQRRGPSDQRRAADGHARGHGLPAHAEQGQRRPDKKIDRPRAREHRRFEQGHAQRGADDALD